MFAGRLTDRIYSTGLSFAKGLPIIPLCWGALIGILAVSLLLSWTLTWGDDRALANAAVLMFACGLIAGKRFPLSQYLSPAELAIMACTWTLLLPWLNPLLETLLGFATSHWLSSELFRMGIGLVLAAPTWFLAGWFCASLGTGVFALTMAKGTPVPGAFVGMSVGVALGVLANAFVVAPWTGAWSTVAMAAIVTIAARFFRAAETGAVSGGSHSDTSSQNLGNNGCACVPDHEFASPNRIPLAISKTFAAAATGGLIAVILRLMTQLMPDTVQVTFAEWIGLVTGLGIGRWIIGNRGATALRAASFWIVTACAAALVLALLPAIVTTILSATTTFTLVFLQMMFRSVLLVLVTAPMGLALAALLPDLPQAPGKPGSTHSHGWWLLPLPLAGGFIAAQMRFESLGLVTLMTVCTLLLVATGLITLLATLLATRHGGLSRKSLMGITCCSVIGLSVPAWHSHDDPVLTTKLLFSTSSFVAHRAGWESRLLPMLDEARAIDVREGMHGPLTLWRSHGMELHLRDCGIPRSMITAQAETHPQFAPEVLQAVFPLVLSQHPNQVLILGASSGVPLATCLKFPVLEVTCAENDGPLIQVIRGPIAQETGTDPFEDGRVQLVTIPPTLAVMSRTEKYDVILSSPPASSIVAGAAMFTVDHYRHVARRLAPEGIFCQRFPCVDYGIDPMRIVVQSMRRAFVEVIAIESSAGEFLLLGTNAAGAFVAGDLPARLQAFHVRRILADSGLDWSSLLNYPAYDDAALGEICASGHAWTNAPANGILALRAPAELLRWGAKLQELHQVLDARRTTEAPYLNRELETKVAQQGVHLSRKSRLLEWMDDRHVTPELLRRLAELVIQQKVVRENPDAEFHSWSYRTALREQLQRRRPSEIQQASHSMETEALHPDDQRRQDYFLALGQAARHPTAERIDAVAEFLQPFDPLVSYFARLEIADLQAKGKIDPGAELTHRLHSIYFSPVADGSTRNIATTLELLVEHPEILPDPERRFDMLNGLIQTLRTHWETRQTYSLKSARRRLAEIERSLVAVDKAVEAMADLRDEAHFSDGDWESRKLVIDRQLTRPLHAYRDNLQATAATNESRTRSIIEERTSAEK